MKKHQFIIGLVTLALAASTQAAVTGTLNKEVSVEISEEEQIVKSSGEDVTIVASEDDQYEIELEDGTTILVSKADVDVEGIVTVTTAEETKVREGASPTADIIKYLGEDAVVKATERIDDFYKVEVDGKTGYIYKGQLDETGLELLPYTQTNVVEEKEEVEAEKEISLGEEIVDYAKSYIGGKYVYGGNDLNTGVDCSGFTQQIMKKFGISIERSSRAQYASSGYKVSVSQIQPGDLVFYGSNGKTVDHVAIYAGNNQIIHANDSKTGIKMSQLYYGKPLIGVKRVIKN